jgi:hypothetical protein
MACFLMSGEERGKGRGECFLGGSGAEGVREGCGVRWLMSLMLIFYVARRGGGPFNLVICLLI